MQERSNLFFLLLLVAGSLLSFLGKTVVKGVILCYKVLISPVLGPTCRFFPSCSSYALMAVEKYGVITGMGLALRRLAKCHPWHPGGIDPLR